MSIGAENGHNLGYFCGHIDKKVFNQDIEPLTNLIPKNKKIVQCGVFVGDKIENNMLSEEELVRERLNLLNEQSIPITHRSSKNNALQENKNTNLLKSISDYLVILKNKEEDLRTRKETIAANDLLKIVEKLKGYGDACQETGDLLYYKKKVEITLNLAKNNETLKSHRGFGRVYVILGKIAACVVRLFKPPSEPKYPFFNPKKTDTIKKVDAALLQFETEVNAWYLKNNKPH